MQKSNHSTLLEACSYFIRPLVRLLLANGIGYREFSEICKSAFIDVASNEYGLRGRTANLSRVAIITGISRKEVKRRRTISAVRAAGMSKHGLSPASMVLRGWFSDPEFSSETGFPLPLEVDGDSPNLSILVKRYAGDLPVTAVISEMKRVGAIEEIVKGRFRPIRKQFILPNVDGQLFASGATSIHNLISTIAHNTIQSRSAKPLFERYAWSNYLPKVVVNKFHSLVAERGTEFLEFFDLWLRKHEKKPKRRRIGGVQTEVGVGVYFFDVQSRKSDDAR